MSVTLLRDRPGYVELLKKYVDLSHILSTWKMDEYNDDM